MYAVPFRAWTPIQLSFIATTTNATLTFADATAEAQGAWIGLDGVTVVTEPPGWPYVITSPESQTNSAGTEATFTASAGGNPSTVQWYLGTNALPGGTNTTLTLIASEATEGSYTAVFSNALGTNSTPPAILTVLQVDLSPLSQTANAEDQVTFTAAANQSNATVQWYFGPYQLPGATESNLTVTANNQTAGNYSAVFSYGNVTSASSTALLTVSNIPLTNGSFELTAARHTIQPGNDREGNVGDNWLIGWDFGGVTNEVFVDNGTLLGTGQADGAQWVFFDSENSPPPGAIFQTFSTIVGQSYSVTYAAIALYYGEVEPKSLTVTISQSGGAVLADSQFEPPAEWTTNQLKFVAESINTTIFFTDTSPSDYGPSVGVDAVTVTPVASPFTLLPLAASAGSGGVVVQLLGQSGQSYIMQTSTNLADWYPVSTNVVNGLFVNITNTLIPGVTNQYWRAVQAQ